MVLPGFASTVLRTSMLHTLIHVHVGGSKGIDLRPAEMHGLDRFVMAPLGFGLGLNREGRGSGCVHVAFGLHVEAMGVLQDCGVCYYTAMYLWS